MSAVIPLHRCAPLGPGDLVGNFRLVERLGAGGMGQVFLAEHEMLGRRVAVKVLHADHRYNAAMHERFVREARLANRVRHPNVVEVTELLLLPDGRPYMVMELVDGVDVVAYSAGGLTLSSFVGLATQLAEALAAAHGAGVVHRDLKPSNILVTHSGRVKVLDFGVARLTTGEEDWLTQTGQVLATPSYMSPEQATGEPADARSDLYSLGVILWELAVGSRPFEGRSFGDWVLLHATQPPLPPSRASRRQLIDPISPALDEVILRCLAKRPEQRFASAMELRAALLAVAPPPVLAPSPRRRWSIAGAGAVAIAAATAVLMSLSVGRHASDPIGPSAMRVSPPPASPSEPPTMEFEPTEVSSHAAPQTFPPTVLQVARPRRAPARVARSESEVDVPASALKDPFAP